MPPKKAVIIFLISLTLFVFFVTKGNAENFKVDAISHLSQGIADWRLKNQKETPRLSSLDLIEVAEEQAAEGEPLKGVLGGASLLHSRIHAPDIAPAEHLSERQMIDLVHQRGYMWTKRLIQLRKIELHDQIKSMSQDINNSRLKAGRYQSLRMFGEYAYTFLSGAGSVKGVLKETPRTVTRFSDLHAPMREITLDTGKNVISNILNNDVVDIGLTGTSALEGNIFSLAAIPFVPAKSLARDMADIHYLNISNKSDRLTYLRDDFSNLNRLSQKLEKITASRPAYRRITGWENSSQYFVKKNRMYKHSMWTRFDPDWKIPQAKMPYYQRHHGYPVIPRITGNIPKRNWNQGVFKKY